MNLTLQTIPSTIVSEILAQSELDGVVLDTEHGCFNNETLFSCIQVITLLNKKCFVRVTDFNKQLIRMCLDANADGIIFSTFEDEFGGYDLISYCNYPTSGKRGCGLVRENKWGKETLCQKKPILIAQIETVQAVENIQAISKIPFDYFVIGPYDLSCSLGAPGNFESKMFLYYKSLIHKAIPLHKLGLFLPTFDNMKNIEHSDRPELIIWGMDTNFLTDGISRIEL